MSPQCVMPLAERNVTFGQFRIRQEFGEDDRGRWRGTVRLECRGGCRCFSHVINNSFSEWATHWTELMGGRWAWNDTSRNRERLLRRMHKKVEEFRQVAVAHNARAMRLESLNARRLSQVCPL